MAAQAHLKLGEVSAESGTSHVALCCNFVFIITLLERSGSNEALMVTLLQVNQID